MDKLPGEELIKAGIEKVGEPLYKDAVQPGAQELGQAVGTILGLLNTLLTPIALVNLRVKAIYERVSESMDNLVRLKMINLKRVSDSRIKELVFDNPRNSGEDGNLSFFWTEEHAEFIRIINEAIESGTWNVWGIEFDDVLGDFLETSEIELSSFGEDFCSTCISKS